VQAGCYSFDLERVCGSFPLWLDLVASYVLIFLWMSCWMNSASWDIDDQVQALPVFKVILDVSRRHGGFPTAQNSPPFFKRLPCHTTARHKLHFLSGRQQCLVPKQHAVIVHQDIAAAFQTGIAQVK
jgi:hypothetical protein